jgi:16S rRNA (guanine1516-N2)-methyltransferase
MFDFVGGPVGYQFRSGHAHSHALAKAAALTHRGAPLPSVVDATAGLGRDAFLLASLGAQVTMIERSAEVYELLHKGLTAAGEAGPEWAAVINRMKLIFGDARNLLPRLCPEVVIVDPMHPPRRGTALVKKEMRLLRDLVGTDDDALQLLQVAIGSASKRVVLKWPLRAHLLSDLPKPSYQIVGKTVRYSVYTSWKPPLSEAPTILDTGS